MSPRHRAASAARRMRERRHEARHPLDPARRPPAWRGDRRPLTCSISRSPARWCHWPAGSRPRCRPCSRAAMRASISSGASSTASPRGARIRAHGCARQRRCGRSPRFAAAGAGAAARHRAVAWPCLLEPSEGDEAGQFRGRPACLHEERQRHHRPRLAPIVLPPQCPGMVDLEGEFSIVFGAPMPQRQRGRGDGPRSIGYTLINDVSARDWVENFQKTGDPDLNRMGKQLPGFCPMGPVIATKDRSPTPMMCAWSPPSTAR